jgi:hypothetical protein
MTILEYEDCLLPAAERSPVRPSDVAVAARPLIYVAASYSANPAHGLAEAAAAFDTLTAQGWLAFVPHTTFLLDAITPRDPGFWYAYDLGLLRRFDALYVCSSEASAESSGVTNEILAAVAWGIPVVYTETEALQHLWSRFSSARPC